MINISFRRWLRVRIWAGVVCLVACSSCAACKYRIFKLFDCIPFFIRMLNWEILCFIFVFHLSCARGITFALDSLPLCGSGSRAQNFALRYSQRKEIARKGEREKERRVCHSEKSRWIDANKFFYYKCESVNKTNDEWDLLRSDRMDSVLYTSRVAFVESLSLSSSILMCNILKVS